MNVPISKDDKVEKISIFCVITTNIPNMLGTCMKGKRTSFFHECSGQGEAYHDPRGRKGPFTCNVRSVWGRGQPLKRTIVLMSCVSSMVVTVGRGDKNPKIMQTSDVNDS